MWDPHALPFSLIILIEDMSYRISLTGNICLAEIIDYHRIPVAI